MSAKPPSPPKSRGKRWPHPKIDLTGAKIPWSLTPKGVTHAQLAKLAQMSKVTVGNVYGGRTRCSIYIYWRLGKALGVSMDDWIPAVMLARRMFLSRRHARNRLQWAGKRNRAEDRAADQQQRVAEREERLRLQAAGLLG